MKTQSKPVFQKRAFTLVITVILMAMLTLIAIGLLTLSSVSIRAAGQGDSMATARNNARLAMLLALGELQKSAGPDQRVTAAANLVDSSASPGITGVWESWKSGTSAGDYDTRKSTAQSTPEVADGEFVTWLASGNPTSPAAPKSPPGAASAANGTVTLVSDRTGTQGNVRGTHLAPVKVSQKGAMAWSVLDEGVKARLDLPADGTLAEAAQRQARLRAPARPQVESISDDTAALRLDQQTASRLITIDQAELVTKKNDSLNANLHDVTPYSASLPVNVADGGLKADLTRAFESTSLPTDLAGRYVYSNSKTRMAPADPLFSTLASYYQLYKKPVNPLQITAPNRYTPFRTDPRTNQNTPNLAPVDGTVIAPVVSRVSVVFSLVSRLAHGQWITTIPAAMQDDQRKHMVYLIYTPVVTVYNPYSVPIQFRDLKVTFRNLPVAFKFFRNGQPQNGTHTLLSTFHISSQNRTDWDDPFSCTISSTGGSASGSLITLYPGEARVFGESHSASTSWGAMTNYLWQNDLDASRTKNVFSGAGWDYRSGFIVDWLVPNISNPAPDARRKDNNATMGVFGVRSTDRVNVEVTSAVPSASGGKFTVDFQAKINNRDMPLGIYEYNYGSDAKLKEILANGNHSTIGKVTYPFKRERDFTIQELTLPNPDGSTIAQWGSIPKQFAIFTLGSRTAHDSLYPGKPGKTSSFVHQVLQMDATKNHPALLPMEMSLLPITGSGANTVGSIDADDADRSFYFSGTSRANGAIHHVSQNLPTTPLVNLADLRHANLASSGHLPLVQYTVGESLASPMVAGDQARGSSAFGYEVLDHSFLANQTLWDGFFFSGIRNQDDATLLFENKSLPLHPRLTPMPVPGVDSKSASQKALSSTAWSDLASLIAIRGGFNVNSTSKSAWKALLTSLRGLEIPVYGPTEIKDPSVNPVGYREVVRTSTDAAFPRLSRPIGDRVSAANSSDNQRRWSGFRELTENEIEKLADAIVTEVRTRGPFLSMAEFVNRRLASSSDDKAARGALEEALRLSGVNDIPKGPVERVISENEASQFGYLNPKAASGNTEEGASAILSQGDLLSAIGAAITVRSDTFVIRAYGDARDSNNRITAKVWCEAVVQRMPSFVDPTDAPEKAQPVILADGRKESDLSNTNRRFGRRFEIVSFRWMDQDEV
jgi:hypothetical protein